METGVKVAGLNLLVRNLRKVSSDYPKEMKEIHLKVAEPVASRARSKVRSRSGKLAGSIRAKGTQRVARIQTGNLIYAPINHYGGYPGDYAGNQFLSDALAESTSQIASDYERLTGAFIERVWESNF